ncbi:MAG: hypothetical protein GY849_07610, partial [Deltaproteobacteria bacterium]|nr:hypothetical protein [Deltaproteobacteria bacterium]
MTDLLEKVKELDGDILAFVKGGMDQEDAGTFNRLALRAFDVQYRHIPLYQRYCDRRGMTPKEISSWDQVPPLPTDAFKAADLTLLPSQRARTFMTSGTTNPDERGKVNYDAGGLRLMDATIREAAGAMLFPDRDKAVVLIIAPPPDL